MKVLVDTNFVASLTDEPGWRDVATELLNQEHDHRFVR
jgi:hypothetical protein